MTWNHLIGQDNLKEQILSSIDENRIPHAQLFVGKSGYGTLPLVLAFANELLIRQNPANSTKTEKLMHADLHFSFPTVKDDKHEAVSNYFLKDWKEFLIENPYGSLQNWYEKLEIENKQGIINVKEMESLLEKITLKSTEGGYKILIIWMVDKMNESSANKFLKMLEEPPKDTLFFLITEEYEKLLPTILSRCQLTKVPRIEDEAIKKYLTDNYAQLSEETIKSLVFSCEGDFNKLQNLLANTNENEVFEEYLIRWTRAAFQAKKNPKVLKDIHALAMEISGIGREKQKEFLSFSIEIFRQAMLENYGNTDLVHQKITQQNFKWEGFAKLIHGANITEILEELNQASYHIERNANPKIIFLNTLISLTRYIHIKISTNP